VQSARHLFEFHLLAQEPMTIRHPVLSLGARFWLFALGGTACHALCKVSLRSRNDSDNDKRNRGETFMTTKARIVTALLGSSLWVGCQGGQIDEVAVTHQAALAIEANMNATAGALSFTTDGSGTFATAAKSTGLSLNTDDVSSMNGLSLPLMRGMLGSDMTQMMTGTGMPSVMTAEERTAETSAKLRRFMDERLFVPANLESKDGETATYLLHSDPSCRPLGDEGAPLPAVDQKCAKDLDAVAVRMRVEDDGGTTTIKVSSAPSTSSWSLFR